MRGLCNWSSIQVKRQDAQYRDALANQSLTAFAEVFCISFPCTAGTVFSFFCLPSLLDMFTNQDKTAK